MLCLVKTSTPDLEWDKSVQRWFLARKQPGRKLNALLLIFSFFLDFTSKPGGKISLHVFFSSFTFQFYSCAHTCAVGLAVPGTQSHTYTHTRTGLSWSDTAKQQLWVRADHVTDPHHVATSPAWPTLCAFIKWEGDKQTKKKGCAFRLSWIHNADDV